MMYQFEPELHNLWNVALNKWSEFEMQTFQAVKRESVGTPFREERDHGGHRFANSPHAILFLRCSSLLPELSKICPEHRPSFCLDLVVLSCGGH